MQEEEPGEAVVGDQLELLVQAHQGLATLRGVGVAGAELVAADAAEGGVGVLAGGGEVGRAVAEVAGEVELEALREPDGLRDRGGMIGEPGGGIGWRAEHGVAVTAALAVGSVERQVAADRDERVLQERAAWMVGVDVAGGDGRQMQRLGEPVQIAGERPVPAGAGALKLHVDVADAVDANEAPRSRLGITQPAGGDETGYVAVAGAAGQAHQAGCVRREVGGVERGRHGPPVRRWPGGGVGEGDEPAQVRVADAGLGQQGQVGAVGEGELRAGDRAYPRLLRRVGERERPAEAVMVGEGDRRVPVGGGLLGELLRGRCPVEEAERRVRVQLDVRGGRHRTYVRLRAVRSQATAGRRRRPSASARVTSGLPVRNAAPHAAGRKRVAKVRAAHVCPFLDLGRVSVCEQTACRPSYQ